MTKSLTFHYRKSTVLSALAGLVLCMQVPLVAAQNLTEGQTTEAVMGEGQTSLRLDQRARTAFDPTFCPGDRLDIELLDLPELSGSFR